MPIFVNSSMTISAVIRHFNSSAAAKKIVKKKEEKKKTTKTAIAWCMATLRVKTLAPGHIPVNYAQSITISTLVLVMRKTHQERRFGTIFLF